MKEIGGYIEFEQYRGTEYHNECIALNSARNCLRYLIQEKKIKKILLPKYNCIVVEDVCRKENVEIQFYSIDNNLNPILPKSILEEQFVYVVNYYGQLSESIRKLAKQYNSRLIVDNVQAFFERPIKGINTIYTCRKYFGVSDGAYLYTDMETKTILPFDVSYKRLFFLAGRYEKNAGEFYVDYKHNEELHEKQNILRMSLLTKNILKSIDYEFVKEIREKNYLILDRALGNLNELKVKMVKGPFMYPLLIKNAEKIRKVLIDNSVFIPVLWPNVLEDNSSDSWEYYLAKNILSIPCDQRYTYLEMEYIIKLIKENM